MHNTFFTADHHFGHSGIIRACSRPFDSVEEMDETLIDLWNGIVGKNDRVIHLGDFAYKCDADQLKRIFNRLNGRKTLIVGNHDNERTLRLPWDNLDIRGKEISVAQQLYHKFPGPDGRQIPFFLSHYAARTWPGLHRGSCHVFGHSHGRMPDLGRSCDVGVDVPEWNYAPAPLELVVARLERNPVLSDEVGHEPEYEAKGMTP
ncbi:metallophosphoesterase [Roseibium aggregatum]|jgi:calcineurin-like phosphoesterase family protein|uniref:Putative phosphoesterase or phosphohydrolase n=1 Tax=Roseibium aggregatum TaxID=187304 RepID=A0A0M6YEV5_9HYPH|nr:metallophosphoesterase [Roseibium aggregatum]CTQ47340.1 putative phosphoesterase or phosphohydrolase [Roseibium aggregatum]